MTMTSLSKIKNSKVADIARRDFIRKKDVDEDSDEDDCTGNESYNIDPSVQMWKPIDYGRSKNSAVKYKVDKSADVVTLEPLKLSHKPVVDEEQIPTPKGPANLLPSLHGQSSYREISISNSHPIENVNISEKQNVESFHETTQKIRLSSKEKSSAPIPKIATDVERANIELLKEKEEMMKLMEQIQNEKKELLLLSSQKAEEKQKETAMVAIERENLRIALENMRAQNELLVNHMKQNEADVMQLVVEERKQKELLLTQMEKANKEITQKVLEDQKEAEKQLSHERDDLKAALRRMEHEKAELHRKVIETERKAQEEAELLVKQREEFSAQLVAMEANSKELAKQIFDKQIASENATKEHASNIAKEKQELESRLKALEDEKCKIASDLKLTEDKSKVQAMELKLQLEEDKKILESNVHKMEDDKAELIRALREAERIAKQHALIVSEQLQKEKEELSITMQRMEKEKDDLRSKLLENEVLAKKALEEKEREVKSVLQVETEMKKNEVEYEMLKSHLQKMQQEKEEMRLQMKRIEEETILREKQSIERIAKERDELRHAVEKMRQDIEMEKLAKEKLETSDSAKLSKDESSKSRLSMKANTSLYDLLEGTKPGTEEATAITIKPSLSKNPCSIESIQEETDISGEDENKIQHLEVVNTEMDVANSAQSNDDGGYESGGNNNEDELAELPAPHRAAARNDVEQLRVFNRMESSLMTSIDSAGRVPLFYAAAYDHMDALTYLLAEAPDVVLSTDFHGDSPIHAAASSGSSKGISTLLSVVGNGCADIRNNMGMTPCHLAGNDACLQALYAAGADLTSLDNSRRSPLFVAAAMNRVDCVQFLLDCLDGDDEAIYAQDDRGDSPLHAAACNGAEDCLLLLLQCGISPLMVNHKGLKAIDLAKRNKKKKCREILAEYHLHFATHSDFDSVLFIATLEGHKKVKNTMVEAVVNGDADSESYRIIRNHVNIEGLTQPDILTKAKSLFSLNKNKSLRLKRYGSWIAYEDQDSHTTYWYNHHNGQGQWNMPDKVKAIHTSYNLHSSSSCRTLKGHQGLASKASMRLKKVGDWIQYSTEQGYTFYYNEKTGDFQWSNPEHQQNEQASMMIQAKKEDWKPYKDPATGAIFWYNEKTNVSQWECPIHLAGQDNRYDESMVGYAEELVEVHTDADLGI